MIEAVWAETLIEEIEGHGIVKRSADDLLDLLSRLSGQELEIQVDADKRVELGDAVPENEAKLGDFSEPGRGL